jgi:LuxR family maltose regulon positive regulatory protein
MEGLDHLVRTKIAPPRRRVGLLRRQRLLDFLHQNVNRKLILISAAAGYGKTTLLVDFLSDCEIKFSWYGMDPEDAEPWTFLAYLFASIAAVFPELAASPLKNLLADPPPGASPQSAMGQLVNEIQECIPDYFLIAIDDFHCAASSKAILELTTWFIDHAPDNCTLILASRTIPELPYVRLAARQEIIGLGGQELAFTADEIRTYLSENHNLQLTPGEAGQLAAESEGWITGILLGTHTLWKGMLQSLADANRQGTQVFNYLAQEVYDGQPPARRDFLRATSILEVMSPELCNALLETGDAAQVLEGLEAGNLFVIRLAGERRTYRYHTLFKDFLHRQFESQAADEKRRLRRRAAVWLESEGESEAALGHFLEAGAVDEAQRLIGALMEQAYQSGRLAVVRRWLERLGAAAVEGDPQMLVMRARVHRQAGEFEAALEDFERAGRLFEAGGDGAGQASVRVRQAAVYRNQNQLGEARRICEEVLAEADQVGLDLASQALGHRILGEVHHLGGDLAESKRAFRQALDLYQRAGDRYQMAAVLQALGTTARRMGSPLEAEAHYQQALDLLEALGNRWRAAEMRNNIGVGLYYQGDYPRAEAMLDRALAEARAVGHQRTEALVLVSLGDLYFDRGENARAHHAYQAGLKGAQAVWDTFLEVYTLAALANLYRLDQAWDQAHTLLDQAEAKAAASPSGYARGLIAVVRGALLIEQGKPVEGRVQLESAGTQLAEANARRELARSRLWLAWACYRCGDAQAARAPLAEALDLCEQMAHPQLLVADGRSMTSMLEQAPGNDPARAATFEALLTRIHQFTLAVVPQAGEAAARQVQPPRLEVHALGESAVKVDGGPIAHVAWGGPLVRELFFYLLERGPVRRELILADFWPDLAVPKAKSVFHATTYRMRRVLPEGTIVYQADDETYAVDTEGDFWYDAAAFEALRTRARREPAEAERLLQQALTVYHGDFLSDVYSNWAAERRAELRQAWIEALGEMGRLRRARGDAAGAIESYRRALAEEPIREDLHRGLMAALVEAGRAPEAVQDFHELEVRLADELGVEPGDEIRALFQQIRRQAGS